MFRADIQALRGWAILVVLLYHADLGPASGYLGVDLFFVISGYLITKLVSEAVAQERFSFADFYTRRAKRLLPAAYTVFAACIVAAMILLSPGELSDFGAQLIGAVTFTGNIVLWQQSGYFAGAAELKPLLHVWSLAIEEQYYLLLPAAIAFTPRRWWKWGVLAVLVASLSLCLVMVRQMPSATFYLLPTRAWELATGSVGALWLGRYTLPRFAYWPAVALLILIPFADIGLHPSWPAVVVCGATLAVIVAKRSAPVWLAWLGDISYSLYLVHWPLFAFARNATIGELSLSVRLGLVVLSLVLSVLLYRYVERPIWKSEFRFTLRSVVRVGGVSLLLVIVGASAAARIPINDPLRPTVGLSGSCGQTGARFIDRPECRSAPVPTVAVWGDSYAMHLVPGLAGMGLTQITKSVCGPMAGAAPFEAGRYDERWARECLAFSDSVMDYLRNHREIEIVVLSSRFVRYLPNEGEAIFTADGVKPASVELAAEHVARTVKTLRSFGKKVVLVSPPPSVVGIDAGRCRNRQAMGLPTWGAGCDLQAQAFRRDRSDVLALLDTLEIRDVPVVRLDALLCGETTCVTQIDGQAIYRDDGHLSVEGSRVISQNFDLAGKIVQVAR